MQPPRKGASGRWGLCGRFLSAGAIQRQSAFCPAGGFGRRLSQAGRFWEGGQFSLPNQAPGPLCGRGHLWQERGGKGRQKVVLFTKSLTLYRQKFGAFPGKTHRCPPLLPHGSGGYDKEFEPLKKTLAPRLFLRYICLVRFYSGLQCPAINRKAESKWSCFTKVRPKTFTSWKTAM